jgi:hypothetical protein
VALPTSWLLLVGLPSTMIPDLHYTEPPVRCHRLPYMTDFAGELRRLGLSEYLEAFVAEGFDTWETVLDITESDL